MAGTFVVDQAASFTMSLLMAVGPKMDFDNPNIQATDVNGVPKWEAQVAVSFTAEPGRKPVSEVINVGITAQANPAEHVQPGPVQFDNLRVGTTPPEVKGNGRVAGGRFWYTAQGIRPAVPARAKSE